MFTEEQREKIIAFAKERVAKNDSFHDFEHVMRTADTTIYLSIAEKADRDVCWAAAMLHDISKKERGEHAELGANAAKKFLAELKVDGRICEAVRDAIYYHNKDFGDDAPMERKVLWDSDKLHIMTPNGFRSRMLPYWIMKKGRKAGIETAVFEYYFYKQRFHTRTAIREVGKYSAEMEHYLDELKKEAEKEEKPK